MPEWAGTDHTKGPSLIVRSSRFLLLFFAAALVGVALIFGAFIIQLGRGPISLSFLTPLIERALASDESAVGIRLHDTILTWVETERALDIRAVGMEFVDSTGSVQATIPEMSVKFSARALLRGLVAPTSLELFGPRLRIARARDGTVSFGMGAPTADSEPRTSPMGLIGELLQPPNPDRASGYLSRVAVRSAFVEFLDFARGIQLTAPVANIALLRDAAGIVAEGSVTVGEGRSALHVDLSGVYRVQSGATDLGIVFSDLSPASLLQLDPIFEPLARLDALLEGTVALSLDSALEPTGVTVDMRSKSGTVDSAPLFDGPLAFDSAELRAWSIRGLEAFEVESLAFTRADARFEVSGSADRIGPVWSLSVDGAVENLPVNDVAALWPETFEPATREWVTANIRDGIVDRATIGFLAELPEAQPDRYSLSAVGGDIRFRDTAVHFLRPIAPVTGVDGIARFDASRFTIDANVGTLVGNTLERGRVEIEGLDGPPRGESIKIEITVSGPVRETLELLDGEPLNFISGFGIDPAHAEGTHRTNAVFAFPLVNALKVEDVAVATASRLVDFAAADAAFGWPVSRGDLTLNVDRGGLVAKGTADIAAIPVGLTWTERFEPDSEVRTRYEVRANLDTPARELLGLDAPSFVSGTVGLGLTYALGWDDAAAGAAEIDLTDATLSLDPFEWRKPPGEAGRAFVRFLVQDDVLTSLPEFMITAGDLEVTGSALFRQRADGPDLQRVSLPRVVFGGNDLLVNVEFPEGVAPVISVAGSSADLRPVLDDLFASKDSGGGKTPAMKIVISEQSPLASVRMGEETRLLGIRGTLVHDGSGWSDVELRGAIADAGRIFLRVVPEGGIRRVNFESDDAGGVLRALDWIDTIRGGEMRVIAGIEGDEAGTISGQLDMQNFVLTDGPVGAQILSLASFSGIADILRGDGITFRRAEVPFTLTPVEIGIKDAKARGADIGIIASGRIDRARDTLELEGEIAPAYTLNSILANIPLIGAVLSGGGDDVFAATFSASGPVDDPSVSVNPLSALTPAIVRRLLTGFGDGAPPEGTDQPRVDEENQDLGQ